MNLARNLERSAFSFPDRSVVSEDFSEVSYLQLNARASRAATALIKRGIWPGITSMKSRLSPFKVPKEYLTVDDFPRSADGKILKRELREKAP